MALVQKKKQKKERRALWPLLLSVSISVVSFLLVLGVAAFLTRNNDVDGPIQKQTAPITMIVEVPPVIAAMVKEKVRALSVPCVHEAIRLDPAAASNAKVRAKLHLAANEFFLDEITPEGFSSHFFQRCLARVTWPKSSLQVEQDFESLPPQGVASLVVEIEK
ncbi:MAG: hypothetical protein GY822_20165 [Deltaproteobacteria bacterium]|nr:hypothetical protein [Deltaproteobacteria bacterium]